MTRNQPRITRRRFSTLALAAAATRSSAKGETARFRGYYPILQTPFGADDRIDLADLEREVEFVIRCRCEGMVWPQLLSEFFELSTEERLETAEAILRITRSRLPVIVGVQASDKGDAVKMAAHAAKHGAAAVISLPGKPSLDEVRAYFLAIAEASKLPVFVQNTGGRWGPALPVPFVVDLAKANPQFGHVKEEAPQILPRFDQYAKSGVMKSILSGTGGKYAAMEVVHGVTGAMGPAGLADVASRLYRLYREGKAEQARSLYSLLSSVMVFESLFGGVGLAKEILVRRGVLKSTRQRKPERGMEKPLDAGSRELDVWLKRLEPYFSA